MLTLNFAYIELARLKAAYGDGTFLLVNRLTGISWDGLPEVGKHPLYQRDDILAEHFKR
jgi:hypothetical protein